MKRDLLRLGTHEVLDHVGSRGVPPAVAKPLARVYALHDAAGVAEAAISARIVWQLHVDIPLIALLVVVHASNLALLRGGGHAR